MFTRHLRVIAKKAWLLPGLLLLSGCPAPPKQPVGYTPLTTPTYVIQDDHQPESIQPAPEIEPTLVTVPEQPIPQTAIDPAAANPLPQVHVEPGLQLPFGVLPVPLWWQLCGFSEVRVTRQSAPQSVELHTTAGTLSLTLGRRFATWNGINIALGFAPVLHQGQLSLHSLDVNKNVYPLTRGSSWQCRNRVLVLDPGHGGPNPGARVTGKNLWEKDLALDWALRIEKLLQDSGWRVVLTRRDDSDLALIDRVAIADAHDADLFISLHFNSSADQSAGSESGLETYCLTPSGMPSNIIRAGFQDDPKQNYPNNQFDTENLLLAVRMHDSLVKNTARPDRGVRRARFMTVLREQKRPAVLLEGGFLSNPAEASLILQPAYRQQLAEAVRDALPN